MHFLRYTYFAAMVRVAVVVLSSAAACRAELLPEPTGAHPVGSTSYQLVDLSPDDGQGSQKDHNRRFTVRLWYPAKAGAAGKPASWVPADQLSH